MNSSKITVFQAEQKDAQRWDAYALNHPDASPYHLFAWKLAIEESYGHRCYYLCAEVNGHYVGILPLVHLHFPGLVNELTALPYCDVGNCLSDNDAVQDALLDEALRIQKKVNINKLNLRGPLRETELKNDIFSTDETGKVRMLLDLPSSSDDLFSSFKSKLRSQVRKAEKNGVGFYWGGTEDIDCAYGVFSKNMHELGSPVHSKSYLKAVVAHYGERARLGLALFQDNTIGMGIILVCGKYVSIPWASTLREYNRLGPNMLLYWNFLKYSADNGYKVFDFGRSTEGEGTYRFKKQWGAQPTLLTWYTYSKAGKYEPMHQPSDKRDVSANMWKKMPLPVANFVGPRLRKYISL